MKHLGSALLLFAACKSNPPAPAEPSNVAAAPPTQVTATLPRILYMAMPDGYEIGIADANAGTFTPRYSKISMELFPKLLVDAATGRFAIAMLPDKDVPMPTLDGKRPSTGVGQAAYYLGQIDQGITAVAAGSPTCTSGTECLAMPLAISGDRVLLHQAGPDVPSQVLALPFDASAPPSPITDASIRGRRLVAVTVDGTDALFVESDDNQLSRTTMHTGGAVEPVAQLPAGERFQPKLVHAGGHIAAFSCTAASNGTCSVDLVDLATKQQKHVALPPGEQLAALGTAALAANQQIVLATENARLDTALYTLSLDGQLTQIAPKIHDLLDVSSDGRYALVKVPVDLAIIDLVTHQRVKTMPAPEHLEAARFASK